MQKITFDSIFNDWLPDSYQTEEMRSVFREYLGEGKTHLEILQDPNFPVAPNRDIADDKITIAVHFLSDKTNRLFAVACCRELYEFMFDDDLTNAVSMAEMFANGEVDVYEFEEACTALEYLKVGDDPKEVSTFLAVSRGACRISARAGAIEASNSAAFVAVSRSKPDNSVPVGKLNAWKQSKHQHLKLLIDGIQKNEAA